MRRRSLSLYLILLLLGGLLVMGSARAMPAAQLTPFEAQVFDTRSDLELLATGVFQGQLPPTWTGNADVKSATVVADLWYDNEQLADQVFGAGIRPPGWLGAAGANAAFIARNVRHDLDLTADKVFGVGNRPPGWRGGAPLLRCDRTLQNAVSVLATFYNVTPTTPESALNFCRALEAEIQDDLVLVVFTPDDLNNVPDRLLAVRGDLERLADEKLGLNNRPAGWIGNKDKASPTFTGDLFLDLDMLANELLGQNTRPEGWIGGIANSQPTSLLSLRHDLEQLADNALGIGQRPNGWQGSDPILRCSPLTQNLIAVVTLQYNFTAPALDAASPTYCAQLDAAANQIAENPPVEDVVELTDQEQRLIAESNYAFAYLDFAATQYMGIMPGGTEFRAWYRNFAGSHMMFISGNDFALFVDYRFTTLPPYVFDGLPSLQGVDPQTFCDASWCNGPGPTPTPTGFGPLAAVLSQGTQPAPVATAGAGGPLSSKTQVSWNNIRVTYLQDDTVARVAQVALELCSQPAQTATTCEPVVTVLDLTTNQAQQPLSVYNTLNVYQFKYGYTTGLQIEGETLYSQDIWISDPTIR